MTRKWLWLGTMALSVALAAGCYEPPPVGTVNPGTDGGGTVDDGGGTGDDAGLPILDDAGMIVDEDGGMAPDDGGMSGEDAGQNGGDDGGMMEMDAGVTPQDLCADVAKKKCDYFIRCRTDGAAAQNRGNDQVSAQERAECEARETTLACEVVAKGWELGRATVDETKYAACIDASYPANTCARDLNAALAACSNAPYLTAATSTGGLCTYDNECINGYCNIPGGATCGTCAAYVAVGQVCQSNAQCDPATSYCTGFGTKTCQAFTQIGQGCFLDAQCGPGNVCATSGNGFTRNCAAAVPLGGTCNGGRYECARHPDPTGQSGDLPETICSVNSGTGTCIAIQTAVGGVCGTGERLVRNGGNGGVRGPICNETEFCAAGLCTPRRTASQPCTSTDQCAFGSYCNTGTGGTNTCVAYADVGGACSGTNPDHCKNLLSCQGATCQPAVAGLGQNCNATVTCSEGYCDPGTNTCTALKADGQACTAAGQCESNACVMGACATACWQ